MRSLLFALFVLFAPSLAFAIDITQADITALGTATYNLSSNGATYTLTEDVTFSSSLSNCFEFSGTGITFDLNGFTITSNRSGDGIEFENDTGSNTVTGPGRVISAGGGVGIDVRGPGRIENIEVAVTVGAGNAVFLGQTFAFEVENCLIYAVTGRGIYQTGNGATSVIGSTIVSDGSHGINLRSNTDNFTMTNCVIASDADHSLYISNSAEYDSTLMTHNSYYCDQAYGGDRSLISDNDDVTYNAPQETDANSYGGQYWHPFVAWEKGDFFNSDFAIVSGFEINAGNNVAITVATDVDGNDRTIGTTDIGCYELQTAEDTGNAEMTCDVILQIEDWPVGATTPGVYCTEWEGTAIYDSSVYPVVRSFATTGWVYWLPEAGSRISALQINGEPAVDNTGVFEHDDPSHLHMEGWHLTGAWDPAIVRSASDSLVVKGCGPNLSISASCSFADSATTIAGAQYDFLSIENCSFIPDRLINEGEEVLALSGRQHSWFNPIKNEVTTCWMDSVTITGIYINATYNGGAGEAYPVHLYSIRDFLIDDYWIDIDATDTGQGQITIFQAHALRTGDIQNGRYYGRNSIERLATVRSHTDGGGEDTRSQWVNFTRNWGYNASDPGNGFSIDSDSGTVTYNQAWAAGNLGTGSVLRLSEQAAWDTVECNVAVATSTNGNAFFLGGTDLWDQARHNFIAGNTFIGGGGSTPGAGGAAVFVQAYNGVNNSTVALNNNVIVGRGGSSSLIQIEDADSLAFWTFKDNALMWDGGEWLWWNDNGDNADTEAELNALGAWSANNQVFTVPIISSTFADTLGDYSVFAGSGIIDIGDRTLDWLDLTEDMAGNARVVGSDIDPGAYEFAPAGTVGACCTTKGDCYFTTEELCGGLGGAVYQGDGTECDPDPCSAEAGACCTYSVDTWVCGQETEAECGNLGGVFFGYGIPCSPDPCAETAADSSRERISIWQLILGR